jgi:hypothetical protein
MQGGPLPVGLGEGDGLGVGDGEVPPGAVVLDDGTGLGDGSEVGVGLADGLGAAEPWLLVGVGAGRPGGVCGECAATGTTCEPGRE